MHVSNEPRERVWAVSADQSSSALTCRACGELLQDGQQAVECPRCKAIHHLTCWGRRGGCATHGCFQLADLSLTASGTPRRDVQPRDLFGWIPLALTVLVTALVFGSMFWAKHRPRTDEHILTLMVPVSLEVDSIQVLAKAFGDTHSEVEVSVLGIPADPSGTYYEEKLVIMLAAKEPPDVIILPYSRFRFYAEQGALTPLDDVRTDVANAVPYAQRLRYAEVGGRLYGLPHPSRAGIFAVPITSANPQIARDLLVHLAKGLPFQPGIDDQEAEKRSLGSAQKERIDIGQLSESPRGGNLSSDTK